MCAMCIRYMLWDVSSLYIDVVSILGILPYAVSICNLLNDVLLPCVFLSTLYFCLYSRTLHLVSGNRKNLEGLLKIYPELTLWAPLLKLKYLREKAEEAWKELEQVFSPLHCWSNCASQFGTKLNLFCATSACLFSLFLLIFLFFFGSRSCQVQLSCAAPVCHSGSP